MTDISGAGGEPPEHSYSIRDRLGLHALDYPIPPSANKLQYMLGGLTFIGIVTLVVTGLFLEQFSNPSPPAAPHRVLSILTCVR